MNSGFLLGYVALNIIVGAVYLWLRWWAWNSEKAGKSPQSPRK